MLASSKVVRYVMLLSNRVISIQHYHFHLMCFYVNGLVNMEKINAIVSRTFNIAPVFLDFLLYSVDFRIADLAGLMSSWK